MKSYTTFDVWVRGTLYAGIAGIGFLVNDNTFRQSVAPLALTYLGATAAVLLAIRAFLDLTAGRTTADEPLAVKVENPSSEPIPTTETQSQGKDDDNADDNVKSLVQSATRNPSD